MLQRLRLDSAAGWGVHLGLSGLEAFDVDTKGDGLANWAAKLEGLQLEGLQPFTRTGSGGLHFLFRRSANCDPRKGWTGPNGATSCLVKFDDVGEWCSGQHYLALPFSDHKSGRPYELAGGPVYDQTPPALAEWINSHKKFNAAAAPTVSARGARVSTASQDPDQVTARIQAFLDERGPAISGQGGHNHALSIVHALLIGFDLSPDETFRWLAEWNQSNAEKWTDDDLWHKIDDAPTLGGEPGYLLNATFTPRPDPALAWWIGRVVRIRATRVTWVFGPGENDFRTERVADPLATELDLSDLVGLDLSPLQPSDAAPRVVPSLTAVDDAAAWEHPLTGRKFASAGAWAASKDVRGLFKSDRCGTARKPVRCETKPNPSTGDPGGVAGLGLILLRCNGCDCMQCADLRRQHIYRTLELVTARCDRLYLRVVLGVHREGIRRSIKAAGGEHGRILLPNDNHLYISDRPFIGSTELGRGESLEKISRAVFMIPEGEGRRYGSSPAWKLLDESKHECTALPELDGPASQGREFTRFLEQCGKSAVGTGPETYTTLGSEWYAVSDQERAVLLWRWDRMLPGPLDIPPPEYYPSPTPAESGCGIDPLGLMPQLAGWPFQIDFSS